MSLKPVDGSSGKYKKATDASVDAHVGMLGVNADKAKALQASLERNGFTYRFPAQPPTAEMVQHAFVRRNEGGENEWRMLNERKNGFHNITGGNVRRAKDETFRVFDSGEVVDVSNEVKPVGDYAGQQADGALAALKRAIEGNPHDLSKAHLDVLKARVAKLEAKAAKSKAKDAGDVRPVGDAGPWSPFSDPDVPPALLKAYSDAFDKAWAEKNSSKKAVLQQAAEKAFEACRRAAAAKSKAKDALSTMTNFDYKRGRSKELDAALDAIKKLYEEREGLAEKVKEIERRITAANAVWRKLDRDFEKASAKDAGDPRLKDWEMDA